MLDVSFVLWSVELVLTCSNHGQRI